MDYDAFFHFVSRRKPSTSTGNLNFSGVLNANTSLSVLLGCHVKKKTVKSDDLSFDLFFRNSQMRDLLLVKVRVEIW